MDFTHFDEKGNAVMVDVSDKTVSERIAIAHGCIRMSEQCFKMVEGGGIKKGDVLAVARIAGIMGAKKCSDLIPLCHNIPLTNLTLNFKLHADTFSIEAICRAKTIGITGVEMEALTGVNVALLTIYDMCKAVDKSMVMENICLLEKDGGKSGHYERHISA